MHISPLRETSIYSLILKFVDNRENETSKNVSFLSYKDIPYQACVHFWPAERKMSKSPHLPRSPGPVETHLKPVLLT